MEYLRRRAVCYEVPLRDGQSTSDIFHLSCTDRSLRTVPLDSIIERLCERPHCRSIYRSLMVEGGASVISSFLVSGLVDLVIITIAPVYVGDGIGVFQPGVSSFASSRA